MDDNNNTVLEEINSEIPITSFCTFLFLKSLRSYTEKFRPTAIYIAWDKKLTHPSTNFRKETMEGTYKGTRDKSANKDIFYHESIIENVCRSLGVRNIYPNVLEADDVIAWVSRQIEPNMVISVDSDLYQLIDSKTSLYHLNKKRVVDVQNFEEEVSVPLESFLYFKAILGDTADNIPGFRGHGKVRSRKLAIKLTENKGDVSKLSLVQEYVDLLHRNLSVMDLSVGYLQEDGEEACYQKQLDELKSLTPNFNEFECWVRKLNFQTINENVEEWKALFTLNDENPSVVEQLSGK